MKSFVVTKMLVFNDKGELLVLRRSQTDERRPGQWDFPGGWVDEGEDMLEAAVREAKEEAGLDIDPDACKLVFGFSDPIDEWRGSGTWLAFLTRVTGRPAVTLSYEHDGSDWLPLETALAQIKYDRQQRMLKYIRDNNLLEG